MSETVHDALKNMGVLGLPWEIGPSYAELTVWNHVILYDLETRCMSRHYRYWKEPETWDEGYASRILVPNSIAQEWIKQARAYHSALRERAKDSLLTHAKSVGSLESES